MKSLLVANRVNLDGIPAVYTVSFQLIADLGTVFLANSSSLCAVAACNEAVTLLASLLDDVQVYSGEHIDPRLAAFAISSIVDSHFLLEARSVFGTSVIPSQFAEDLQLALETYGDSDSYARVSSLDHRPGVGTLSLDSVSPSYPSSRPGLLDQVSG